MHPFASLIGSLALSLIPSLLGLVLVQPGEAHLIHDALKPSQVLQQRALDGGGLAKRQDPTSHSTITGSLKDDIHVLLNFKQKVSEDPGNCLTTWNVTTDIAKWSITVDDKLDKKRRVATLNLNGCGISGHELRIDGFLDKLTGLTDFLANSNNFTGTIPKIGRSILSRFHRLDLSNNKLDEAEFPTNVLEANITFLDIRFNSFKGTIPDNLFSADNANVASLWLLFLNNNRFSGPIPATIGQSKVTYLSLARNQFTGPIPASFGDMPKLQEVLLLENQLTGHLPDSLTKLVNLTVFDASRNRLSGPLPAGLDKLRSMEIFGLADNNLTGTIPPALGTWINATGVDLSNNNLTGPVPAGLCRNRKLKILLLSGNCLDLTALPQACTALQATARDKKSKGYHVDFTNRPDCPKQHPARSEFNLLRTKFNLLRTE